MGKILERLTKKPSKFIATMLVGNNIALVVYGFYMGDLLVNWLMQMGPFSNAFFNYWINDGLILTQTLISTLVILFTAEFLPKVFFQIYANSMLKFFAVPAYFFYIIFTFISATRAAGVDSDTIRQQRDTTTTRVGARHDSPRYSDDHRWPGRPLAVQ